MARPVWIASLGLATLLAPLVVSAQTEAANDSTGTSENRPWYEAIQVNGFVSTAYSYNFNRPPSRTNQLRVFDFDDNSFRVDVAELVVQRAPAGPGEAGFRVDAVAGSSIPQVSAAFGLFRGAFGPGEDFDLQQAYASYVARVGRGLRFDGGKFVTHLGYEVIEGYDGFDDHGTRSFLFGYAIPFTHTGLRLSYPMSDQVAAQLLVVNGWDDARDNNDAKSVGAQLALAPSSRVSLIVNGMTGAERSGNNDDLRSIVNLVAVWRPTDRLAFGLDLDHGWEENLPIADTTATWTGGGGYVRAGLSPRFALCLRAEVFDDADGVRTGVAQTLGEMTLTPEIRLTPHAILRGDFRLDWSDQPVFESDDGPEKQQPTASLNFLYTF